jgi:hypothetical protein
MILKNPETTPRGIAQIASMPYDRLVEKKVEG